MAGNAATGWVIGDTLYIHYLTPSNGYGTILGLSTNLTGTTAETPTPTSTSSTPLPSVAGWSLQKIAQSLNGTTALTGARTPINAAGFLTGKDMLMAVNVKGSPPIISKISGSGPSWTIQDLIGYYPSGVNQLWIDSQPGSTSFYEIYQNSNTVANKMELSGLKQDWPTIPTWTSFDTADTSMPKIVATSSTYQAASMPLGTSTVYNPSACAFDYAGNIYTVAKSGVNTYGYSGGGNSWKPKTISGGLPSDPLACTLAGNRLYVVTPGDPTAEFPNVTTVADITASTWNWVPVTPVNLRPQVTSTPTTISEGGPTGSTGSNGNNNNPGTGNNQPSDRTSGSGGLSKVALIGIIVGAVVLIILIAILFFCFRRRRNNKKGVHRHQNTKSSSSIQQGPPARPPPPPAPLREKSGLSVRERGIRHIIPEGTPQQTPLVNPSDSPGSAVLGGMTLIGDHHEKSSNASTRTGGHQESYSIGSPSSSSTDYEIMTTERLMHHQPQVQQVLQSQPKYHVGTPNTWVSDEGVVHMMPMPVQGQQQRQQVSGPISVGAMSPNMNKPSGRYPTNAPGYVNSGHIGLGVPGSGDKDEIRDGSMYEDDLVSGSGSPGSPPGTAILDAYSLTPLQRPMASMGHTGSRTNSQDSMDSIPVGLHSQFLQQHNAAMGGNPHGGRVLSMDSTGTTSTLSMGAPQNMTRTKKQRMQDMVSPGLLNAQLILQRSQHNKESVPPVPQLNPSYRPQ